MPSLWRQSLSLLRAPVNELAFAVRSRLRWRRGEPDGESESKDGLFDWLDGDAREVAECRAAELRDRFDLDRLSRSSTRLVFAENIALLDRLEALAGSVVSDVDGGALRAIDVGCGTFQYATALQRWWTQRPGARSVEVRLRGIEIDGHGIYRDGHSRADHAEAHAALAGPGVSFEVADFTRLELPPQDAVTMLFPFLNAFSLLSWGSPLSHLQPRRCLSRAVAALRPGGLLIVANQTGAEFDRLRLFLTELPVTLERQVGFGTDLVPYAEQTGGRVGSLWRREA